MDRRRSVSAPRSLTVLVAVVALLTGCSASGNRAPSDARTAPAPRRPAPVAKLESGAPAHVAVIVMENKEYGDVIGSESAPFVNALARRYALARSMYAITHPSLPNYLALTGGSTFAITSDCTSCTVGATSIVNQLAAAHISWRAYMEDLPRPCFTAARAGGYAKKHDPFAYYTQVTHDRAWCTQIVPLGQLYSDERAGVLPRFIWISPNLCHDMHDCGVATGDRFLSSLIPTLLRSIGHDGLLFLLWDEGTSDSGCCGLASGGHIVTIVAGPGARAGAMMRAPTDTYSVLQTIEDVLGLPRLRAAACRCTPSLEPLLANP